MSNLFEDYREIKNVRDKLDLVLELVSSAPRRVFLTEQGKVKAVVLSPADYEDLWNIELDRDMKLCDEDPDVISHEEFMKQMEEHVAKLRKRA
jgi:hypothetical protein